ncbi:MAG: tandem-95 repeat protein [Chloroflexi bacterium]|nr:tandem-95 repeat protein [Chloroflexota bacterium]
MSLSFVFTLGSVLAAAPVADDDEYSVSEDTAKVVPDPGVLGNDTDDDFDTLTATVSSPPTVGTLVFTATGAFTYTPPLNYNGSVTFTYRAHDGGSFSNEAVVTITVTAVNDPPIANNDDYTTTEDITLTVGAVEGVLANDSDVDDGALSASLDVGPSSGDFDLSGDGSFVYTPTVDYSGLITFTYFANDTISDSLAASTVAITVTAVNDDPILAVNDGLTVSENGAMTITNSLLQVTDVDNGDSQLSFLLDTAPAYGVLKLDGVDLSTASPFTQEDIDQEKLVYNHSGNDTATADLFKFAVSDGAGGSIPTTTFPIAITLINYPPTAVDDEAATLEDTAVISNVISNDSDPDGDLDPTTVTVTVSPGNGSTSVNSVNGAITYTPTLNFNGSDGFVYEVCDDGTPLPAECDTATVTVTVTAVNDDPTLAVNANLTVEEGGVRTVTPSFLRATDVDNPDAGLTFTLEITPSNGQLELNSSPLAQSATFTQDDIDNNRLSYAHNGGETTSDSFNFSVSDGVGGSIGSTLFAITVTPTNDPPIAGDDADTTAEEDTAVITDVLLNDGDVDGNLDPTTVTVTVSPSNGSTSVNTLNGNVTYTPDLNFNGIDNYDYLVCDDGVPPPVMCDTATVTITVTAVNDAPVLDNTGNLTLSAIDEDVTNSFGNSVFSILASDSGNPITDPDAGAVEGIAVIAVTNNINGVWEYTINGGSNWQPFGAVANYSAVLLDGAGASTRIRFVPAADYNGSAGTITFRAWDQTDGHSNGDTGVNIVATGGTTAYSEATETATLTINPINDAPVLDNSGNLRFTTILEDTVTQGDGVASILASDGGNPIADVDTGALEGIAVTDVDNSDGTWQYRIGATWVDFSVSETSATLLNPQARIRFSPDLNFHSLAVAITFRAWDQTDGDNGETGVDVSINGDETPYSVISETVELTVSSVNDIPVLDLNGSDDNGNDFATTFIEDSGGVIIVDTDMSLTDIDNTHLQSATVTLTNFPDDAAESLSVTTSGTNIAAGYNSGNGVLSLTGGDTIDEYRAVLRSLTYNNTSQDPTETARIVVITVNDFFDDSDPVTSIVTVDARNDPPIIDTNVILIVNEGGNGSIHNGYLKITDVDNTAAQIEYTLLSVPAYGDLLVDGVLQSINDTFTQEDIDNNLVSYAHDGSEFASDSFTFSVLDGSGGSIGATPFNITINANNDTPVLAVNAGLTEDEGATGIITNAYLQVTDTDNTAVQLTYRVEITPVHGTLQLDGSNLGLNGEFTQDDIDNNRLSYVHDGSETTSDDFTFAVEDGAGGNISSTVFNITINPVNDLPVVDLNGVGVGLDYNAAFTEGAAAVAIVAADAVVTDADNANLTSVTATLTNNLDGAAESLSVTTGGIGIGANYNAATGVLSLTGPASVANFQTVLRTLVYDNTTQDPTEAVRLVEISADDGDDNSLIAKSFVAVTAVNDDPLLALNAGLTLDFGRSETIGSAILRVTDVDNSAAELVYTALSVPANGLLKLNGSALSVSATFTQDDIDNNRLVYEHNATETTSDSFTFSVSDGDGGEIGTTAFDIVINPKPKIFLPVVLNNYVVSEPNNTSCDAYGINLDTSYQFLPDDEEDWYTFTLNSSGKLTVKISNYAPSDGQLMVYKGASCTSGSLQLIGHDPTISPSGTIVLNNQTPGVYYVRVFTAVIPSNPTYYTLDVQFP